MEKVIENFIAYMREAKKASQNTEISYERDLKKLARYLRNQKIMDFSEVTKTDLQGYLKELQKENLALSTISRNIASIRALYHYMIRTGKMQEDPSETLKPPKLEKKMPEILSVEEVDRLLKQPNLNTPKGIRDNAMMELMYATGMRVSELIHLQITDINLQMGYVICHDSEKERIIPRVYTNKPRTTGEGYKGMVHQPDPEKAPDMLAGLIAIRKMHIHAIQESGFTCADEMLYPENYRYLSDILSYVAVGARSVEDQQHRLTVSGMDVPAGMKNPTSGDYSVMLNSVVAAQGSHRFIYRSWEVETTGNPLAHTILRGAVNKHGEAIPNYHYEDLRLLWEKYQEKNLQNPAVIVDTNHSNSNKKYEQQVRIAKEVLHSRMVDPELHKLVKGFMIESYIEPGNQKIGGNHIYGKSITDPCLGWEESEKLLYTIAEMC